MKTSALIVFEEIPDDCRLFFVPDASVLPSNLMAALREADGITFNCDDATDAQWEAYNLIAKQAVNDGESALMPYQIGDEKGAFLSGAGERIELFRIALVM